MDNFSKEHIQYLKRQRKRKTTKISFQISILVVFFVLWELLAQTGIINPFIFSTRQSGSAIFIRLKIRPAR